MPILSDSHGDNRPTYIAMLGNFVVWTDSNDVGTIRITRAASSAPVAGQILPQTLYTGGAPGALVTDGSRFIYYADPSRGAIFQLDSLNLTTRKPIPFVQVPVQGHVTQMAIDATNLYWVSESNGTVMSAPLAGGGVTVLAQMLTVPFGLCIDTNNVYYSLDIPPPGAGMTSTIFQVPKMGGASVPLDNNTNGARWMASDANGHIFWIEEGGNLVQCTVAGDILLTLTTGIPSPGQIATDGINVYYISRGTQANGYTDGFLAKIAVGGGVVTPLVTGLNNPFGVVIGPRALQSILNRPTAYHTIQGIDQYTGLVQWTVG
jgi:hypothetical protein